MKQNPRKMEETAQAHDDIIDNLEWCSRYHRSTLIRAIPSVQFPENITNNHLLTRTTDRMLQQNKFSLARWASYSAWTLLAFAIMLIFGSGGWAFPDGSNPSSCPPTGDKNSPPTGDHNSSLCGAEEVLSIGSQKLYLLASFILGGFLLSTRQLWLTRRTAYCALCGATRNLIINVTTLAPPDSRKLLARWAILGYELSVLKARSLVDTIEGKSYLQVSRLIQGDEWEQMVNGDRHTTVWYWVQSEAMRLHENGEIDGFKLQTICNAVTLSRDKANDLMSVIDRDQPPPYIFVCALVVNVNLLLSAVSSGLNWAVWMNDAGGWPVFTEPRLYLSMIILYLYTTIFATLFDICALLYNPFGPREFDIRHDVVGKGIRHLAISLSKKGGSVPKTTKKELDGSNSNDLEVDDARITMAEQELTKIVSGYNEKNRLLPGFDFNGSRDTGYYAQG